MNIEQLQIWDNKILELVNKYNLNCYPQEFEICDHFDMIGYMSYSGMPSRYPHWSWGKSYEKQKTLYDYGVGGLPYEMVINSNPCLAYLMRDNSDLLQILTIAHVYGHNDFFANNFTFTSATRAELALEMFKNHADRVRSYIEDPSIGVDRVEEIIDAAHALSLQRSKNFAIRKLNKEEQSNYLLGQAQILSKEYDELGPKEVYKQPDLNRNPIYPDQDILNFIFKNSDQLEDWQLDLINIVDSEAQYFIPQIETKIMNEGWASYWHHKILNELDLEQGLHLEFLVNHNQVLRPTPGGLNPYHLGFIMWHDIERRWNEMENYTGTDENESPGRKKIFEIRKSDRDVSFLRRFLTEDIMRELDLFQHEKRGKDRVITKVSDKEAWETVKETLIKSVGMGSIPVIKVLDSDYDSKRSLYLIHEHDGRDLQLEFAEKTLRHVETLWKREVVLETILNSKKSLIRIIKDSIKIDKLE